MLRHPERWKNLRARYETPAPRKLLACDGGGIRGVISLGILSRIEQILGGRKLCDYFDFIAGTSTGAIIAAGLARGMTSQELLQFYLDSGTQMFEKRALLERLKSLYTADPLRQKLRDVFGSDTTLEPQHFRSLFMAVLRNISTGSPWPLTNNPEAKYNDPGRPDSNLKLPLWQVVRASTAAPVYFPPEVVQLDPSNPERAFVFVDGGTTPYNNPAWALYRTVTDPAFFLEWERGEDKMLLVSIGTGTGEEVGRSIEDPEGLLPTNVAATLSGLMNDVSVDQDINCRAAGRCVYGPFLDREVQYMYPAAPGSRAFRYMRYNVTLTQEWLDRNGFQDLEAAKVRKMDLATEENIRNLYRIGQKAAEQVDAAHFGPFL